MATITTIPSARAGGGNHAYRAQVRYKGHNECQTFTSRRTAEAWAKSIESAIDEGRNFPHAAARRTALAKLVEDYTATKIVGMSEKERTTRARHLRYWQQHFKGSLSEVTPAKIRVARDALATETFSKGPRVANAVRQQIRELSESGKTHRQIVEQTGLSAYVVGRVLTGQSEPQQRTRSAATVNRYLGTLSDLFAFAIKERDLLSANPVSKVYRRQEPRGRTRFLTDEERTRLLEACATSGWNSLYSLVLLALSTGARRGELLTLRWSDVDLKAGRALVRESKNGEQRTLPLAGRALEALRALRLQGGACSQYLFPAPNGRDEPAEHIDAYWYVALQAAGVEDMHFHDLRHTCASMLAAQGCSLLEIADVLGHKTLAMVKRYSHLVVDHKAKVIEKMIAAKGL